MSRTLKMLGSPWAPLCESRTGRSPTDVRQRLVRKRIALGCLLKNRPPGKARFWPKFDPMLWQGLRQDFRGKLRTSTDKWGTR
jgi:hypothetical protein